MYNKHDKVELTSLGVSFLLSATYEDVDFEEDSAEFADEQSI